MVIYIAGSIPLFRGKRSNHFRLQRQSKHGALCRLKGQAAAPFPDKYARSEARAYLSGKPCIRPPRHPPTEREKIRVGLYG